MTDGIMDRYQADTRNTESSTTTVDLRWAKRPGLSWSKPEPRTWHQKHAESMTPGEKIADAVTGYIGSWQFIIFSNVFVFLWVVFNIVAIGLWHWDPYPFILLNLVFSWGAWNATPLILMSGNRASQRDRAQAEADYSTNVAAKKEIEALQIAIGRLEGDAHKEILGALAGVQTQLNTIGPAVVALLAQAAKKPKRKKK